MTLLWEFLKRVRPKPIDIVVRRYLWGVHHYGETEYGRQRRLVRRIQGRMKAEDYRCRLPDAKHPVIRHKLRRTIHPHKIAEWVWQ